MRHTLRALVSVLVIGYCLDARAEESGSRWWRFGRGEKSEEAQSSSTDATTTAQVPETAAAESSGVEAAPSAQQTITQPPLPNVGPNNGAIESGDKSWMLDSPKGKVSWPRLHMPEMPKPKLPRPQLRGKSPNQRTQTQSQSQTQSQTQTQSQSPTQSPTQSQSPTRNSWAEQPVEQRKSPMQAMSNGARRVGNSTRTAWHKTVDVLTPGTDEDRAARVASRDAQPPFWKRMFGREEQPKEGPQTVTEWMAQERLDP